MSIDLSENINPGSNVVQNLDKEEKLQPFDPLKNLYQTKVKQDNNSSGDIGRQELSKEEKRLVRELKQIARRVRRHEQAHKNVAGKYAGRIYYDYTEGPNGKRYPTEGHIKLDTRKIRNQPEKNIDKMETIRKAALAPQKPSKTDRAIAMDARQKEMQSRTKLMKKKTKQISSNYKNIDKEPSQINEQNNQIGKEVLQGVNILS